MRHAICTVIGIVLAFTAPRTATAQASVAGRWSTEFDTGIRNENGVETSMGKREATFVLAVTGDSVTGTWQPKGDANGPAPAVVHLTGKRSGAKIELASEPVERTVSINGDEQRVRMVTTYSFEVHGDLLEGTTRTRALDGTFEGTERPFSAQRAKP